MAATGNSAPKLEVRFTELLSKLGLDIPRGARRPTAQDQRLAEEIMEAFLDDSGQRLVSLLSGEDGVRATQEIPLHQLEAVVSLFYKAINDMYIGVDSHPPSRFLQVHPFLLGNLAASETPESASSHEVGGHTECHAPRWVRIVPLSLNALKEDFTRNPDLARRYFELHDKRHVTLLRVDPQEQIDAHNDILSGEWTGDVGLWLNTCALLFEANIRPANERLRLELVYPHEPRFQNYLRYVRRLIESAEAVTLKGEDIKTAQLDDETLEHLMWSLETMFEPRLADVWDEFVSPQKRVSKLGPFVDERLEEIGVKEAVILDAATGVGCDSVYLASKGHSVTSNEIDVRLIAHAIDLSEKNGDLPIEVKRFDWRHFEHLAAPETFDVVLALGNSLSCLSTESDVRAVLARFAYLLRPNGLLIVDERNYPAMFERRKEMTKNDFRFPGNVVYCSQTIRARPRHLPERAGVDNDVLTLEYIRVRDGQKIGTFDVLPFKAGQVKRLLEESGFRSVVEYYNLSRRGAPDKAQFVTYVASRTYDASDLAPGKSVDAVIAFTDITGATQAKERLGQAAYTAEWDAHEKVVLKLVKKHRGRIVNSTGDGFLLAFSDASKAVDCLGALVADPGTSKLVVRAGLTKGSAIEDHEGNLRGRDVDVAARICDRARPNLVVTDDRLRLSTKELGWSKLGLFDLKGAGGWNLWRLD